MQRRRPPQMRSAGSCPRAHRWILKRWRRSAVWRARRYVASMSGSIANAPSPPEPPPPRGPQRPPPPPPPLLLEVMPEGPRQLGAVVAPQLPTRRDAVGGARPARSSIPSPPSKTSSRARSATPHATSPLRPWRAFTRRTRHRTRRQTGPPLARHEGAEAAVVRMALQSAAQAAHEGAPPPATPTSLAARPLNSRAGATGRSHRPLQPTELPPRIESLSMSAVASAFTCGHLPHAPLAMNLWSLQTVGRSRTAAGWTRAVAMAVASQSRHVALQSRHRTRSPSRVPALPTVLLGCSSRGMRCALI